MKWQLVAHGFASVLWLGSAFAVIVLFWKTLWGVPGDTPFIGPLLINRNLPDLITPWVIIAVFAYVLADIAFHARRIGRENLSVRNWRSGSQVQEKSRAGQRARLMSRLVHAPERLCEAIAIAAGLDAEEMEHRYVLTKAFIWVLPVLGFIGTASAMAHSIAGFGKGLSETNDVKVLADRLSQLVIPGLSSAFTVTMLALAATIVAHVCVTAVFLRDQDVLHELDVECAKRLSQLPHTSSLRGLAELSEVTQRLADTVGQLTETPPALVQSAKALYAAAKKIERAAESVRDSARGTYQLVLLSEKQP